MCAQFHCVVNLLSCSDMVLLIVPPGWNVDECSDLPRNLRLVGSAAASGSHHLGSGPLLGLYQSQPAPPEPDIELLAQPSIGVLT